MLYTALVQPDLKSLRTIDELADRFEAEWMAGRRPDVGMFVTDLSGETRLHALAELVQIDVEYRARLGEIACEKDYRATIDRLCQHESLETRGMPHGIAEAGAPESRPIKIGRYFVV